MALENLIIKECVGGDNSLQHILYDEYMFVLGSND